MPPIQIGTHDDIEIPQDVSAKWQEILDILADYANVPVALVMKVRPPYIEVFSSSQTTGNPYKKGDSEKLPGLYCETVMKTDKKLLVPDAQKSEQWKNNPDIKLGMISYLGFPLKWPDGKVFGTICILDKRENEYTEKIEQLMNAFKDLIEFHLDLIRRAHLQELEIDEYKRLQQILVKRELKMIELKKELAETENQTS